MLGHLAVVVISLSTMASPSPQSEVTVRGRTVCLDSSGKPSSDEKSCDLANGFAFRAQNETLYRFSPTDKRVEMLTDARVRSQELEIEGWLCEENEIEIIKLYSVHDGELYDIFYRCDVCNITAHTPGPCWCCYEDFELRETPSDSKSRSGRQNRKEP